MAKSKILRQRYAGAFKRKIVGAANAQGVSILGDSPTACVECQSGLQLALALFSPIPVTNASLFTTIDRHGNTISLAGRASPRLEPLGGPHEWTN